VLLVGLAAAVAAGVAMVLWSQGENYTPLYSGLADRDVGEITAQLDSANIPYQLDAATGGLLVPADRKYEVRMQMASAGLPRGAGFGIEDMPDRSSFGQTPFMENALYVRAVETELARTIGSMQPVEMARVHLALPPQSVFLRQKREPSASVMLKLYSGRRLDDEQVQSVVHLVASSVPDLVPSRVTVVDQSGALLSSQSGDSATSLTSSQFDYRKQVESDYAQRIQSLLGSIVGPERVRASVSADIDFTQVEQTRESFDPNVQLVRSEQTSEDTRRGDGMQGVPGALSNQPPELTAPAAGNAALGTTGEAVSSSRSQTRNFELDKTVSHTRGAVGAITRLSIGVLVDNKPPAERNGDTIPLTEQELASLTEIVRQAVGFDVARGDTISVVNSAFQPAAALAAPEPLSFLENPQIWSIARQVLGAVLVLALAYFVLRPMMQVLTRPQPVAAAVAGQVEYAAQMQPMFTPGGRAMALPMGYDDRMAAARSVAGHDPRQVAQVVRNWVAEDHG
jgi:flagellar M-ring protein FliF